MALWLLLAVAAAILRNLIPLWIYSGIALLIIGMVDIFLLFIAKIPTAQRSVPGRFALGEEAKLRITISKISPLIKSISIFDGIPEEAKGHDFPISSAVSTGMSLDFFSHIIMMQRGVLCFGSIQLMLSGHLGCFSRKVMIAANQEVKVYPNYAPVLRLSLLATQNRQDLMGLVKKSRTGTSRDFHQLRDYRQGDSLSQIDWKATSRRHELISRDYQEQRNQQVVFLLDCGRRMRAIDDGVPHFDHCLNALLFVSYVALRQGDHIAVQSFGGSDRWLPPVKGLHSVNAVLNHLYDAEATGDPSDFKEAAEHLMMRVKRRALVVVLTNLRSEDDGEIMSALRLMQSKHLVLLASLGERVVRDASEKPVEHFSSALKYLAARQTMEERREILLRLQAQGISSIDVTAEELAVALANRYMDIKGSGRL